MCCTLPSVLSVIHDVVVTLFFWHQHRPPPSSGRQPQRLSPPTPTLRAPESQLSPVLSPSTKTERMHAWHLLACRRVHRDLDGGKPRPPDAQSSTVSWRIRIRPREVQISAPAQREKKHITFFVALPDPHLCSNIVSSWLTQSWTPTRRCRTPRALVHQSQSGANLRTMECFQKSCFG